MRKRDVDFNNPVEVEEWRREREEQRLKEEIGADE